MDLGQRHDDFTDFLKPCDFCGSGFVDLAVSWHCGPVSYQAICDRCYTRGPLGFSMIEAVEKWNTRISFDWLATVAALQMKEDAERDAALMEEMFESMGREIVVQKEMLSGLFSLLTRYTLPKELKESHVYKGLMFEFGETDVPF